jgi:pyrroline-5-carboxylate reductase
MKGAMENHSVQPEMLRNKIGFIGGGEMARALAQGFLAAGLIEPAGLMASDPRPEGLESFQASAPGAATTQNNADVAAWADVLFLAVKPQHMAAALDSLKGHVSEKHLVISIAAGVTTATLTAGLGDSPRLVRVMPNTPCLVGKCAAGFSLGPRATKDDGLLVRRLLESVGVALELDEKLLDAVTGLSGSGPAFVYTMIEAMADGGVAVGLPRNVAAALAVQTVRGAAEMVIQTGEHPAVLKDRVASPGGTTIAGLAELESRKLRAALIAAVRAATERSIELGKS